MKQSVSKPLIAIYHQHLHGGGATRVVLHLVEALLGAGYRLDLIVHDAGGDYAALVPAEVRIITLEHSDRKTTRRDMRRAAGTDPALLVSTLLFKRKQPDELQYLSSLKRYVKQHGPALIIANLWQLSMTTLLARALSAPAMRVVCVFHSSYFFQCALEYAQAKRRRKWRRFFAYCRCLYSRADALITVSQGIANDLSTTLGLPSTAIQTIYNPVVPERATSRSPEPPDHPWFKQRDTPVVVAVGRLSPEKNYRQLIHAVARVHRQRKVRLVILGEGPDRAALEQTAATLGLQNAVDLPGWVDDPAAFFAHAGLFVLSSQWEGLPLALIEAMASGCPVIAYDCAHGPREILDNGQYGALISVGDITGLADAIIDALAHPVESARLQERASDFSVEAGVAAYLRLVDRLLDAKPIHGSPCSRDPTG